LKFSRNVHFYTASFEGLAIGRFDEKRNLKNMASYENNWKKITTNGKGRSNENLRQI
jgi:hypothetical protein